MKNILFFALFFQKKLSFFMSLFVILYAPLQKQSAPPPPRSSTALTDTLRSCKKNGKPQKHRKRKKSRHPTLPQSRPSQSFGARAASYGRAKQSPCPVQIPLSQNWTKRTLQAPVTTRPLSVLIM